MPLAQPFAETYRGYDVRFDGKWALDFRNGATHAFIRGYPKTCPSCHNGQHYLPDLVLEVTSPDGVSGAAAHLRSWVDRAVDSQRHCLTAVEWNVIIGATDDANRQDLSYRDRSAIP